MNNTATISQAAAEQARLDRIRDAAPELLEACKELLYWSCGTGERSPQEHREIGLRAVTMARAAIEMAEGR